MSKVWVCKECGNTERFIAYGSLPVNCVVAGDGYTILDTEVLHDCSPDPDYPEYCLECESENIEQVDEEELNDDNNERT